MRNKIVVNDTKFRQKSCQLKNIMSGIHGNRPMGHQKKDMFREAVGGGIVHIPIQRPSMNKSPTMVTEER